MKTSIMLTVMSIVIGILPFVIHVDLGTIQQRHDFIKSIMGNLDDVVVAEGLISDRDLHKIGAILGICHEMEDNDER